MESKLSLDSLGNMSLYFSLKCLVLLSISSIFNSSIDIENTDLDKMDREIKNFSKNMEKKYKDFLPKNNLDSKK